MTNFVRGSFCRVELGGLLYEGRISKLSNQESGTAVISLLGINREVEAR